MSTAPGTQKVSDKYLLDEYTANMNLKDQMLISGFMIAIPLSLIQSHKYMSICEYQALLGTKGQRCL